MHCPLLVERASHLITENRFLLAQAWFNLDANSASFALHSRQPPGCGVSGDQIRSVSLPPLEADIPSTYTHAAVKAIEPGAEQLSPKYSLRLSKPLVFWEKVQMMTFKME